MARISFILLSLWFTWQAAPAGGSHYQPQGATQSTASLEADCRGGIDPWGVCSAS